MVAVPQPSFLPTGTVSDLSVLNATSLHSRPSWEQPEGSSKELPAWVGQEGRGPEGARWFWEMELSGMGCVGGVWASPGV